MFSPSSGSLNSVAPGLEGVDEGAAWRAGAGGACSDAEGCGRGTRAAPPPEASLPGSDTAGGGAVCWVSTSALGADASFADDSARAFVPAPFSTVKMTCPTLSLSPSLTRISCTTPLTEEGTSITALSVSSSMTGWPSFTSAPGEIMSRTRSPCSMFSPNSGSLNSVTVSKPFSTDGRIRLFGIDAEFAYGCLHSLERKFVLAHKFVQGREHNVFRIHFKEVAQRGPVFTAAEAIGA